MKTRVEITRAITAADQTAPSASVRRNLRGAAVLDSQKPVGLPGNLEKKRGLHLHITLAIRLGEE